MFKLELEMKISAFESSFLNEEEAKWASAIGGRDAPFFVLLRLGF